MNTMTESKKTTIQIESKDLFQRESFTDVGFQSGYTVGAEFNYCSFKDCSFSWLFLTSCTFTNCIFNNSKIESPMFEDVTFKGCWFLGVTISGDGQHTNTVFDQCFFKNSSFIEKHQTNEKNRSLQDDVAFVKCKFHKTSFADYCLEGTKIKECEFKASEFSGCVIFDTRIEKTTLIATDFADTEIEKNVWNTVRFKKCLWYKTSFGNRNMFEKVTLMDSIVQACSGEPETFENISIVPYSLIEVSECSFNVPNDSQNKPQKSRKAAPPKNYTPHIFASEGLL